MNDSRGLVRWVEIDRAALVHNIREFRRLIGPRRKLLAVVKANAYGHGLCETAPIVLGAGADWLGVNSIEEAVALHDAGNKAPVLILGSVAPENAEEVVARGFRIVVYDNDMIDRLAAASRKLDKPAYLHFKLETGTNRQGIPPEKIAGFIARAVRKPGLRAEGLYSHFANIEDTTNHSYPLRQLEIFRSTLDVLKEQNLRVPIRHFASTAATIIFPETWFNLVRAGIGIYGLWPSKETYLSCIQTHHEPLSLKPVLSWKARIAQVKTVAKDSFIGYGCTYKTGRRTRLAVVPVGYYDGYPRDLSNAAYAVVRGGRAPVRGRVAMNFFMADITDIPGVRAGDDIVLIGKEGREEISADKLASMAGTISYEILSRINPLIPRIVV